MPECWDRVPCALRMKKETFALPILSGSIREPQNQYTIRKENREDTKMKISELCSASYNLFILFF